MAFYTFVPRHWEQYPHSGIQEALMSGLTQGLQNLGRCSSAQRGTGYTGEALNKDNPTHKSCHRSCFKTQKRPYSVKNKRVPNSRDPPEAWMWWLVGGETDSSSSESEDDHPFRPTGRTPSTCRGRATHLHHPGVKRTPSRSASNTPPTKKKETQETENEKEEIKFNFTCRKNDKGEKELQTILQQLKKLSLSMNKEM